MWPLSIISSAFDFLVPVTAPSTSRTNWDTTNRCPNAVLSSYEIKWPPISYLLAQKNKLGLLTRINAAIKSQNAKAIERIGKELKEMHMDYITDAFVLAAKSKLMCYRCKKKVEYIDDLCYCEISDTQCHHGTTCCTRRRIQAVAYS
uniref:Uncharacterized protein n=1 Tax=Globodera rostochiensis TaxID=31243 RepID=A0A914HR53_GLORO